MELSSWWEFVVGRSRSKYAVRDRVHKELIQTRERVQSVTDNTWQNLDREFRRLKHLKNDAMEKVHEGFNLRKCAVQAEIEAIKAGAEGKARSFRFYATFYSQLFLFISPVVYGIYFICSEHPNVLLFGIIYLVCLALFLLWSLVVPSKSHRGVSYFKKYELTPEEEEKIEACIRRAEERSRAKPKQNLWDAADKDKPLFILSLDGGGIKGAVSARILARICDEFPDFLDHVGLIAGCSTGSILGGMLATGFTPAEIVEMFNVASPVIFRTTVWEQLMHLGGLSGSNHDGEGKYAILSRAYRGLRMSELNTGLCITASHVEEDSYTHNHCAPRLWSNVVSHHEHPYRGHHSLDDDDYESEEEDLQLLAEASQPVLDMKLADIVNGSTAAPLYFPSHQGHVDGGLWSNNPAMAALSHIIPARRVENVSMLSISTGLHIPDKKCKVTGSNWGLTQWLPWIIDFLFNSSMAAAHLSVRAMLRDRYHRIDPVLPKPIALNDVGAMEELIQAADSVNLNKTFRFLEKRGFKRRSVKHKSE